MNILRITHYYHRMLRKLEHQRSNTGTETLKWDDLLDGDWFDAGGISMLFYAVLANNENVVRDLLQSLQDCKTISQKERRRRLVSAAPVTPIHRAGILSRMNVLCIAMSHGSPSIVTMLLDEGFDPMLADGTALNLSLPL